ncbi:MAG: hypothetical protein RLZZ179_1982 [Verrucomicrobiota bacterium]|jgi:hypothetical protein
MLRLILSAILIPVVAPAASLRYNRDIRPLLSDNCFHCHGPDATHRKGGLRLDIRESALQPADSGKAAIVPGKPDESELIVRLHHADPDELMPPPDSHKSLTAAQKEILRQWIADGAAYEAHWAYTPIVQPEIPALNDPRTVIRNPIDAFIQQPLLARGIAPSPEAPPATLTRRLTLDLTGLPPSQGDAAIGNAEVLVAKLLASPQYGERMAQHWLDVVRYADTVGFHGDQNHNAWAYRDWVIDAFAQNMPFDRFTREQLAGDLLPKPTDSQWTATCFNRLTMMTREGGAQPKEYLAKYTADRVRTLGMAWLGATTGCAECHDHKFDPWTQKDFYALGAFFADVKQWGVYNDYAYTPNPDLKGWSNDHPFPPERRVVSRALRETRDRLAAVYRDTAEKALAALPPERQEAFASWQASAADFLKSHPDGWTSPVPTVNPSKDPREMPTIAADGRINFPDGKAAATELTLPAGVVTAIRIELLPDPARGGSISRGGEVTLKPSFFRVPANGKAIPLKVRAADADRRRARYSNGFEIPGIAQGWVSERGAEKLPHTAIWVLEEPIQSAADETLRVSLPAHTAASLRVSVSPLITSPSMAKLAADAASWLIITKAPAAAALLDLDQQIAATRDGTTPVMVTERAAQPLTIRVLARGNWQDESGPVTTAATPGFLPAPDAKGSLSRLDLANWLVSPQNPLTARVIMNRLWRQFFGTGLSAQTDDLGAQGEAPSHPELLDWLAAEFRKDWDLRRMVQLIVSSHTYRQSSTPRPEIREADPLNRWLASQNARRLEAECVRDNALAIAGLLDLTFGGPPVKPYQPADYYTGLQFPDRTYTADYGSSQYRRGIYTHWQRTFLHPMLANFDAPSREDCIAIRTASNTPQQALTLLNDPTFVEAARVLAGNLLASPGTDAERIATAFRRALHRQPSEAESASLLAFLDKVRKEWAERSTEAARLLTIGLAPPPAGPAAESAAWTSLCRVILNLHETITRY